MRLPTNAPCEETARQWSLGKEGIAILIKLHVYEQWTCNGLPFLITVENCLLAAFRLLGIFGLRSYIRLGNSLPSLAKEVLNTS